MYEAFYLADENTGTITGRNTSWVSRQKVKNKISAHAT
jgi:hypothetical protein